MGGYFDVKSLAESFMKIPPGRDACEVIDLFEDEGTVTLATPDARRLQVAQERCIRDRFVAWNPFPFACLYYCTVVCCQPKKRFAKV